MGVSLFTAERYFGHQTEHEEIEGNPHRQQSGAGKDQRRCFLRSEVGEAEQPEPPEDKGDQERRDGRESEACQRT